MDVVADEKTIPLVVDLDGTLIKGDLFWESLFQLLRSAPWLVVMLPLWFALGGKARLKSEIAKRVDIDAGSLPYRTDLVERIRLARDAGRTTVLATGSARKFAEAIAEHLGCFDVVEATCDRINLTSERKADLLKKNYGDGGFDYAGNSSADLKVFDVARRAIVVAPDRAASRWQSAHGAELVPDDAKASLRDVARMLRPHQWMKNVLIFVPVILDRMWNDWTVVSNALLAFVAFSLTASAIYVLNDLFDMPLDRRHPKKRRRPFASGALSVPQGIAAICVLLPVAALVASSLPPFFWLVLGGYLLLTTAYSLSLKRMLLIDVFTLAGLYATRIFAGTAATGIDVSYWLLAFSIFFFLSLALVKRFVELRTTEVAEGERIAGRGYRADDESIIGTAGVASGFTAALVLALYLNSPEVFQTYATGWFLWPLPPIVLYIVLRIWILARRDHFHDDPVVFLVTDWRSQLFIAIGAVLILLAGYSW